jgi:hypothetical protein
MAEFEIVQYGEEAIEYIRSQLELGREYDRTLPQLVLQRVPLDKGQVTAYLPRGTTLKDRLDFEGGILFEPMDYGYIADFVANHLANGPEQHGIFQDNFASDSSPVFEDEHLKLFFYQSEVYYFLANDDMDKDRIIETLKTYGDYPSIAVLTSLPKNERRILHRDQIEQGLLEKLVDRVEHLLVGAYDEEVKLVWSRNTP